MQTDIIEPEEVNPKSLVVISKPSLPKEWDYNKSVKKMKGWIVGQKFIRRWRKLHRQKKKIK